MKLTVNEADMLIQELVDTIVERTDIDVGEALIQKGITGDIFDILFEQGYVEDEY